MGGAAGAPELGVAPPLLELANHCLDVDAVVDVGRIEPKEASTIFHLKSGILRRGVLAAELEAFLEELSLDSDSQMA